MTRKVSYPERVWAQLKAVGPYADHPMVFATLRRVHRHGQREGLKQAATYLDCIRLFVLAERIRALKVR